MAPEPPELIKYGSTFQRKRERGGGEGERLWKNSRGRRTSEKKKAKKNLFSTTERKRHLHLNKTRRSTASGLSQET